MRVALTFIALLSLAVYVSASAPSIPQLITR